MIRRRIFFSSTLVLWRMYKWGGGRGEPSVRPLWSGGPVNRNEIIVELNRTLDSGRHWFLYCKCSFSSWRIFLCPCPSIISFTPEIYNLQTLLLLTTISDGGALEQTTKYSISSFPRDANWCRGSRDQQHWRWNYWPTTMNGCNPFLSNSAAVIIAHFEALIMSVCVWI